jgi:RNA polymerase sigma-70 factor (ECF subfamily)
VIGVGGRPFPHVGAPSDGTGTSSAGTTQRGGADPLPAQGVGRVRAVLALGGVPPHELDDGVQQVRLRLIEHEARRSADPAAGAEEIRDPVAWAVVVASRVAVDWHRGRARDDGLRDRLAARWTAGADLGGSPEDRVLALAIAAGMEALPLPQQQVLTLRFYADLSVRDIAVALGVPEGTVKSRLHAAVASLRERLREIEVI